MSKERLKFFPEKGRGTGGDIEFWNTHFNIFVIVLKYNVSYRTSLYVYCI